LFVPVIMFSIGMATIMQLRRSRTHLTRTGANPKIEHNPNQPPATQSPSATKAPVGTSQPIPLHRAFLNAWGDLLRSRESLLLRLYSASIRTLNPDALAPTTLSEARQRFSASQRVSVSSDSARFALESKMVLGARMIAAWLVLWTTILPTGILGSLLILRIRSMREPTWMDLAYFSIAFVILFPVLCVMGLLVQSIFIRPFNAILNRFLGSAHDTRQEPTVDDPREPDE
jgi:hypothetical protein